LLGGIVLLFPILVLVAIIILILVIVPIALCIRILVWFGFDIVCIVHQLVLLIVRARVRS
jgi:hypothetical protein